MRKRYFVLAAIALIVASAAYSAFWFSVAGGLRAGLEPWAAARRSEGYTVAWETASVGGFPLSFRFSFEGASFGGSQPAPFTAKAPTLVLSAAPWNLERWQAVAPHGAELAAPGASFDAARLDGSVRLRHGDESLIDVEATALNGQGFASGLHAAGATLHLALPAKAPADHHDAALDALVEVAQLTLPAGLPPLGNVIDHLSLAATLKGRLPSGGPSQSLAAWRDDGGTVELAHGALHWGNLAVDATGTMALDGNLQPIGALTATIEGQNEIVDAAVNAGDLRPKDAGIAKIVLGVLARPGPDGRPQIKAPIRIQDEHLFLGPAKIADLPRIEWR